MLVSMLVQYAHSNDNNKKNNYIIVVVDVIIIIKAFATRKCGNHSDVFPLKAARRDSISNLTSFGVQI